MAPPVEKFVPVHDVAFCELQVRVDGTEVSELAVRSQLGPVEVSPTVTAVHGPQLLFSFDSVMEPVPEPEDLSAQARRYTVPAVWNVRPESVAVKDELVARADERW